MSDRQTVILRILDDLRWLIDDATDECFELVPDSDEVWDGLPADNLRNFALEAEQNLFEIAGENGIHVRFNRTTATYEVVT